MEKLKKILSLLVVVGLIYGIRMGCQWFNGEGNARITDMTAAGLLRNPHCWITLKFGPCPAGINPRDIRLELTSVALARPQVYDWNRLAPLAQKKKPTGVGRLSAQLSAASNPPDFPIDIDLPLALLDHVENVDGTDLFVEAKLFWGGRQQDRKSRSIRHLYQAQ